MRFIKFSDRPSKNQSNSDRLFIPHKQRSPHLKNKPNSDRHSKKSIKERSPIHPINSDRFSNNQITRRSLFAKSKTAMIALNDVKQMLSL